MRRLAIALTVSAFGLAAAERTQERQRFTARTDGVVLDVAVIDDDSIVRGLTPSNFEVLDNGVRQTITVQETANTPLDVMVVMQPFDSLRPAAVALAQRETRRLFELLLPDDRIGVVLASAPPALDRPLLGTCSLPNPEMRWNGTVDVSLWDALFSAYQQFDKPDRRKVTLVFTNTDHDVGVLGARDVAAAAELQPAQMFILLVDRAGPDPFVTSIGVERTGRPVQPFRYWHFRDTIRLNWIVPVAFVDLVEATGGQVIDLRQGAANIADVLGYLRAEYLITYTPTGVSEAGWHKVEVKLKGRKGTVITRPGYWSASVPEPN